MNRSSVRRRPSRTLFGLIFALELAFAREVGAQQPASRREGISPAAMTQIVSLLSEKESRTKVEQKIDSQLLYASRASQRREAAPGVARQETSLRFLGKRRELVVVDIRTTRNPDVVKTVLALGGKVITDVPAFLAVRAALPLMAIAALAAHPEVRFIAPAAVAEFDTGSVNSEGDRALGADTARGAFGLITSNVRVGVLSDSATASGIARSVANGNLAAGQVTVLPGQAGAGSDEGLAMLEIINDIAPGVKLFFATANPDAATFASNIIALRNPPYNCDIIVDDVRYPTEAPFQESVIAQAVNTVTATGALYFASAGNSGNKTDGTSGTWVGDFVNGGAFTVPGNATSYEVHSFQTIPSVQNFDLVVAGGSSYALTLFWADPEGGSANDYDLFQLNAAGTAVVSSSTNVQNGTQNAFESTTLSSAGGNRVVVVRKVGAASRALYVSTGRGRLSINTNGYARGHSAAPNAIAVAAVPAAGAFGSGQPAGPFPGVYTSAQQTELFSSDGPARKFFDPSGTPVTPGNFLIATGGGSIQQYPVVTAPDGVTTSVSGFAPFYGTSASAPHAAAVAALLKAHNPSLTADQIRTALVSTALDIEAAGVDNDTGAGILRPSAALASVSSGIALAYGGTATISGGNGNAAVDFNETNNLTVSIINVGSGIASNVVASLSTNTAGVTLNTATATYGNIAGGATATNAGPFVFTTSPTFRAGVPIQFYLTVVSGRRTFTLPVRVPTGSGIGAPVRFDYAGAPVPIPDNNPVGGTAAVTVSSFTGVVGKVTASCYVNHTFDSDLTFFLIAPDGTSLQLFAGVGGSGDNFGTAVADASRTVLDDAAATAITAGTAPFVGSFRPSGALSLFNGLVNGNGTWQFKVVDGAGADTGNLNAVSLFLSPVTSIDGGNP